MNKRIFLYSLIGIAILVLIYFLFFKGDKEVPKFTLAEVKRGNLSNTITSTGTLNALKTVDVGTQVSGKIDKIFVDFNSNVKKGTLLAILDTTNLALAVRDAKAAVEKTKAQYEQASTQYSTNKELYNKGYLSELDFINSKTALETSLSDYHSAQTALERAKTNLNYAYIYSPINGKIINRNVEEGQTVAASFSSPTLFQIAENLSNMQILASVDETDIGEIKVGQDAQFSVQAYPNKEFTGKVVQIRLNPQTVQNVVNYTVVINADNKENLLLPGMTATIDFYIEQKNNVLMVPNSALRFQPSEEVLAEFNKGDSSVIVKSNLPDSLRNRFRTSGNRDFMQNRGNSPGANMVRRRNFGRIWYLDENKKLKMAIAVLGLTDGKNTEIVRSRDLKQGMKVIIGVQDNSNQQTTNNRPQNFPGGFRRF